jgi:hypothetical protein
MTDYKPEDYIKYRIERAKLTGKSQNILPNSLKKDTREITTISMTTMKKLFCAYTLILKS